jgi:hypothetical protein
MNVSAKPKRVGHLRQTLVLIATVAVVSIVLLLKPTSASGLRSTSDRHAASHQTRTNAPAHTKAPRAAHVGKQYVLVIPQQPIDPGDRRPC